MHGSCVCHRGFILRSELGQNYVSFIVTKSVCIPYSRLVNRLSNKHVSPEFDVCVANVSYTCLSSMPLHVRGNAPPACRVPGARAATAPGDDTKLQ